MDIEEAKNWLKRYQDKKSECKRIKIKIDQLERLANGNGGMSFGITAGHASEPKTIKDYINDMNDLQMTYRDMLIESEKICAEIEKQIYNVGIHYPLFGNILSYYYVHDLRLMDIAAELHYSYIQTKRLFKYSLKTFCKVYNEAKASHSVETPSEKEHQVAL